MKANHEEQIFVKRWVREIHDHEDDETNKEKEKLLPPPFDPFCLPDCQKCLCLRVDSPGNWMLQQGIALGGMRISYAFTLLLLWSIAVNPLITLFS